jgi:hypothetical protein
MDGGALEIPVVKASSVSDGWPGQDGLVDVGYDRHGHINKQKAFTKAVPTSMASKPFGASPNADSPSSMALKSISIFISRNPSGATTNLLPSYSKTC